RVGREFGPSVDRWARHVAGAHASALRGDIAAAVRLAVLFALAACGTSPASPVDSAPPDDASDAPMPPGCDSAGQRDLTDDDAPPAAGTPEGTGRTHAPRTVLCGTFDDTPFDGDITADVDGYLVTFAEEADLLIRT